MFATLFVTLYDSQDREIPERASTSAMEIDDSEKSYVADEDDDVECQSDKQKPVSYS